MSNNAYVDRGIFASLEDRSFEAQTVWLAWRKGPIMQKLIISRLTGSQQFCNAMNTSYADPPMLHKRRTLRREIHCVATLLPTDCRASAAT